MARVAKQLTDLQHAKGERSSNMYLGSTKNQSVETWALEEKKFVQVDLEYPPGLYKIVDEVIVNALDHCDNFPKKVTDIKISFDKKTGEVCVWNNGPGMPIVEVENVQGKKMWNPQMIAAEFRAGDNFDDHERTTGGVNGLGLKLTNAFSDYLILETYDEKKKTLYKQKFEDRLEKINEPILEKPKNTKSMKPFTSITFMPAYSVFYKKKLTKENLKHLYLLFKSRAYHAAACSTATVSFNDKPIPISGFSDYVSLYLPDPTAHPRYFTKMTSSKDDLVWDICIAPSDAKFQHISLINGMFIGSGGNHIKHIQNLLVENLKSKIEKEVLKLSGGKFNKNIIFNNLFVFMKGKVKGPNFSGQRKDKLDTPVDDLKHFEFKKADYQRIWEVLQNYIMQTIAPNMETKTRVNRGTVNAAKYERAKYAGHKTKSKDCMLFVAEGDSAKGVVSAGITNKKNSLSYDYCGVYSVQGVIVNARKEHKEVVIKSKKVWIPTKKFQESERIQTLFKIMGLDVNKTYKTKEERDTLRYGCIVGATDQDEDGKGQIFGLIMNLFMFLWPNLVKHGYVKRLNTPIVRLYPKQKKQKVMSFYTVPEFEKYLEKNNIDIQKYKVEYYKGLSSHSSKEIENMFSDNVFNKMLHTYQLDKEAMKKIEIYFGNDTDIRKEALATPVDKEPSPGPLIDVTEQLDIDTKSYQRDNIIRKLPHLCDGLVQSRRKVLYAARKVFGRTNATNKIMKVGVFSGKVISEAMYHHGDASLNETISKMAQTFIGGRVLPYLSPKSLMGNANMNGKDSGAARYVKVNLNQRLVYQVFPPEDDWILKYVDEDGEQAEPQYYLPIIPTSVMENMSLPATGWKIQMWARDYRDVIKNVRDLITGKIKSAKPMRVFVPNCSDQEYSKVIKTVGNKRYSIGVYEKGDTPDSICITRMPLQMFSGLEKEDFKSKTNESDRYWINKDQVADIQDDTTDDGKYVSVKIQLKPGGLKYIRDNYGNENFDCYIEYFGLKQSLSSNLNMIDEQGYVREYKKYDKIVDDWFQLRKQLYEERIDREIILTKLRILYYKNLIRFNKIYETYGINNKTPEEKAIAILTDEKYQTFNKTILENPKYTKTEDLEDIILRGDKSSYNYLLDLSLRQLTKKHYEDRKKKLKELEEYLKELEDEDNNKYFKGSGVWLKELDALEETIKLGMTLGWDYGEESEIDFA